MGMLKEGTDDSLVTLASGGNSLAKNILMSRYQPFVLRLVQKMNVDDPEDTAQDILIKVSHNLNRFEHRSLFSTWLYRIVVNHVLQLKKRSTRLKLKESNDFGGAGQTSATSDPEKILRYLQGMITCLESDQRITLILAGHFKFDHNAASEILGISPANFRKRLSRARQHLQYWTNHQCSLLSVGSKTCHCVKKKRYFISQGWVDQNTGKFTKERLLQTTRFIQTMYGQGEL